MARRATSKSSNKQPSSEPLITFADYTEGRDSSVANLIRGHLMGTNGDISKARTAKDWTLVLKTATNRPVISGL